VHPDGSWGRGSLEGLAPNFGKLILRKISKLVATRCHILKLKCTKFDFGWGSAPDPTGGAYSAPLGLLTGFEAANFSGKGGDRIYF